MLCISRTSLKCKPALFRVPLSLHFFATLRNWLRYPLQSLHRKNSKFRQYSISTFRKVSVSLAISDIVFQFIEKSMTPDNCRIFIFYYNKGRQQDFKPSKLAEFFRNIGTNLCKTGLKQKLTLQFFLQFLLYPCFLDA